MIFHPLLNFCILYAMQKLNFYKKVHFVGILGVSMRNLARFAMSLGITISGSDDGLGKLPSFLEGVTIKKEFSDEELKGVQLAVYTGALSDTHPQLMLLKKLGIELVRREEFLAKLLECFKTSICVSGTHGKTTTCGMIGSILKSANLQPAVHIGGDYGDFFPFRYDYIVCEACEYKRSFLSLSPNVCVILNTEHDHPDCYQSEREVKEAFLRFSRKTKADGIVIAPFPIPSGTKTLTVGVDVYAEDIKANGEYYSFIPVISNVKHQRIKLSTTGRHNVDNALFAIAVANHLKIDYAYIKSGLENFTGVNLRYTQKLLPCGRVVVDYAHHPSEIKAVLDTARLSGIEPRVFFQPHTYSRTKAFFDNFVEVLSSCKSLFIIEEYPARETPSDGVSAYQLFLALKDKTEARYLTLSQAFSAINSPHPLTLVLGAGNISQIIE